VQVLGLLFVAFALTFVAGLGWYTGQCVVQGLAGRVGRGKPTVSGKRAALPGGGW
jgi:hypothetical protein